MVIGVHVSTSGQSLYNREKNVVDGESKALQRDSNPFFILNVSEGEKPTFP